MMNEALNLFSVVKYLREILYDTRDEGVLNLYQATAFPCLHGQVWDRGVQHTPHDLMEFPSLWCNPGVQPLPQRGEQRQAQISMFQKEAGVFPPNFAL